MYPASNTSDGSHPVALLRPVSARFADASLEREFAAEFVPELLAPFARRALGFGALTFGLYGLHDLLVLSNPSAAWLLRYGAVIPAMVLAWALTFTRLFQRWSQWILLAYGLSATVGVLGIAVNSPAEPFILYAGFTALFVTIGPLIGRLDVLRESLYTALSALILLAFDSHFAGVSWSIKLAQLWTLGTMGLLGTMLSWLNEKQAREAFVARRIIRAQADEIARERARSDALLRNVLPDAIAERLKTGESSIADGYDEATVLFADIVGFTPLASQLPPKVLVARLNEVFTAFDGCCTELGLEKIKTIGDAYMVVGGIPQRREDHAEAVVRMALAMLDVVAKLRDKHADSLDVRIGVHSGPLVAGVIGRRKFAYDVWGDTVNTASRMESHALPGRIQVSDRTRNLIAHAFELEDRGEIAVKGKGPMRTWFVVGERR